MSHTLPAAPRNTNFHFPLPESILIAWNRTLAAAAGWSSRPPRRKRARATILALNAIDPGIREDIGLSDADLDRIRMRVFHANTIPSLDGRP